ncbi:MAG TPA: aminodeoxychorismate/anthranilate synthase component II [Bacteroidia bacterium]|nr:aminodeoxychorismate/anthranilate synthase component II [Bacteroidia bacterium]HNU32651.1 aminodeoxychorismate/anthranilate synthase component II [Bacteroidia bacterium]
MRLAVIDNYDSFTFNLVHYFEGILNSKVDVFRNDKVVIADLEKYSHICISPGPGMPDDAGITIDVIKNLHTKKNILGVCLGMQAMAVAFGGKLINLEKVQHGVARTTHVNNTDKLFKNLPANFLCARYHSWVVHPQYIPKGFAVTAIDDDENIMAFSNTAAKLYGVQFHPESVLTENGKQILINWLN